MESLNRTSFEELEHEIVEAGRFARNMQRNIRRFFKEDGSVLTETDLAISSRIVSSVHRLFSGANIISEEEKTPFDSNAPFTFVLDPIDGTDVYSQGLPSYAVALGILDRDRNPVGAIIHAPRFGLGQEELLASLFPGGEVLIDGQPAAMADKKDEIRQIMITSHEIGKYDFSGFHGKARSLGSTILHILLPALMGDVQGALLQRCYVWDIAASHAIIKALGMDISYLDGSALEYTDGMLLERKKCRAPFVTGTQKARESLRAQIALR